jgi:hypothetical protein
VSIGAEDFVLSTRTKSLPKPWYFTNGVANRADIDDDDDDDDDDEVHEDDVESDGFIKPRPLKAL